MDDLVILSLLLRLRLLLDFLLTENYPRGVLSLLDVFLLGVYSLNVVLTECHSLETFVVEYALSTICRPTLPPPQQRGGTQRHRLEV